MAERKACLECRETEYLLDDLQIDFKLAVPSNVYVAAPTHPCLTYDRTTSVLASTCKKWQTFQLTIQNGCCQVDTIEAWIHKPKNFVDAVFIHVDDVWKFSKVAQLRKPFNFEFVVHGKKFVQLFQLREELQLSLDHMRNFVCPHRLNDKFEALERLVRFWHRDFETCFQKTFYGEKLVGPGYSGVAPNRIVKLKPTASELADESLISKAMLPSINFKVPKQQHTPFVGCGRSNLGTVDVTCGHWRPISLANLLEEFDSAEPYTLVSHFGPVEVSYAWFHDSSLLPKKVSLDTEPIEISWGAVEKRLWSTNLNLDRSTVDCVYVDRDFWTKHVAGFENLDEKFNTTLDGRFVNVDEAWNLTQSWVVGQRHNFVARIRKLENDERRIVGHAEYMQRWLAAFDRRQAQVRRHNRPALYPFARSLIEAITMVARVASDDEKSRPR